MESTISNFSEDVKIAHKDEQFVTNLLQLNTLDYSFNWVGQEQNHYYDGDIQISDGTNTWYADVKTDDTCYRTHNILAEHRVKFRKNGWQDGFMQKCNYNFVFYLSKAESKIYIIDFAAWKQQYKKQYKKHILIPHDDIYGNWLQTTDAYLMGIDKAKELDIILATLSYDDDYSITIQ